MSASRWLALVIAALVTAHAGAAEKFALVPKPDFFSGLPADYTVGACSAVAITKKGEILIFHREKHPILCFSSEGKYLRAWGDDEMHTPHGLRVDPEGNIWATDIGVHRVFKYDSEGKLLLTLGTGVAGTGKDQFDRPTDIAFGSKGEVYVSDGYGNSRVLKFSPSGALITTWGTPGKRDGEFNVPHSIVVDRQERVLVGDRENNRIQVFDADGKHLATWKGFAPYGLAFDASGMLFVADGRSHHLLQLDDKGKVAQRWGTEGIKPGQYELPHMLAIDSAGDLYVAEVNGKRVQKLVRQAKKQ
jgi:DNA-binding beta-propeller fold protein YncE